MLILFSPKWFERRKAEKYLRDKLQRTPEELRLWLLT